MSAPVRRILVLRFRNLGDVLLATPLLRALKRRYPEAKLDYLVEEGLAPLLEGSEDFDRLLAWPRRPRHRWLNDLRWAFRLRGEGYDLVLDLHGSVTSALFTGMSRAAMRIGYRVRGRHFSYTEKIDREWPREREPVYEPARHFRMVVSLGIEPEDLHLRLPRPAPREGPDPWGEGEGARILCTPGATWRAKQWPAAHYAQLIRRLENTGNRVLLVGSESEQDLLAEISEASSARLRAGTSVREMVSLIAEADLLVGTDSGTRHVAVALGTM